MPTGSGGQVIRGVRAVMEAAASGGFDGLWVTDLLSHVEAVPGASELPAVAGGPGGPEAPALEAYSLLGALAASQGSLFLGAVPLGGPARHPAVLAKIVTTVDVLTNGRCVLTLQAGIGADAVFGPRGGVHAGTGFATSGAAGEPAGGLDPLDEDRREARDLDEALRVCRSVLDDDVPTVWGHTFAVDGAINRPRPVAEGGVPIAVVWARDGAPPPGLVRAVARHADALIVGGSAEEVGAAAEQVGVASLELDGRRPPAVLWIDDLVHPRPTSGGGTTPPHDRPQGTPDRVDRVVAEVAADIADRLRAGASGCIVSCAGKGGSGLGDRVELISRLGPVLNDLVGRAGRGSSR
ncbi:MAG: LLM class flavin-dependent oxidoreductase [Acidimicrobiales bacterium]